MVFSGIQQFLQLVARDTVLYNSSRVCVFRPLRGKTQHRFIHPLLSV
ncbi:hypothetical protein SUBVAR_06405 [Subdoligranulum variabile DSM 15176]|uniref:Uncharacterized protein n=1 Tax=Subdoligranulum variabile DSM 15176 TaxID=411471 RepID=D1PPT9_9FIRM|nr:hypothetical protein SUBVAR_06405 [Subdoligranulum variabile DSM 15176]